MITRWTRLLLLRGSRAPDAGRAVGSGDAVRESGRVAGVFLFVRAFRVAVAIVVGYSGCIGSASCRLEGSSFAGVSDGVPRRVPHVSVFLR